MYTVPLIQQESQKTQEKKYPFHFSNFLATHHIPSGSQRLCHNLLTLLHQCKIAADLKLSKLPLRKTTYH